MLLGRCEFGKDDYSLNIVNLPHDDKEITEEANIEVSIEIKTSKSKKKKTDDDNQPTLFQ
jgi:adenine-specific DNA-methyltransferase